MTPSTSSNQPLRHHAQTLYRHPNPERAGPLILPGLFIDMLDQTGTLIQLFHTELHGPTLYT